MEIFFSLLTPALPDNGPLHHDGGEAVEDNSGASGFHALLMALAAAPIATDQTQPLVMDASIADVPADTAESDADFSPKTWMEGMEQVHSDLAKTVEKTALLMEAVKDVGVSQMSVTLEDASPVMVHGHSPPLLLSATSSGDGPPMVTTAVTEEASALSIAPAAESVQTALAAPSSDLSAPMSAPTSALAMMTGVAHEPTEAMNVAPMVWSASVRRQPAEQLEPHMDALPQGASSSVRPVPNPGAHGLFSRVAAGVPDTEQTSAMTDTLAAGLAFPTVQSLEDGRPRQYLPGVTVIAASAEDAPEDGIPAHAPPPKGAEAAVIFEKALLPDEEGDMPVMTSEAEHAPRKALFTETRLLEAKLSVAGTMASESASATGTGNATTPPVVPVDLNAPSSPAQGAPPEAVAPQPATPVFVDAPKQTIVREVRAMMDQGVRAVAIRLNPPSLGALRIEIVSADGDLELRLSSATPATRALLESQGGMLRDALQEQGIRVSRISFADSFADNVEHGSNEHSGQPQRQDDAQGSWRTGVGNPRGRFFAEQFGTPDAAMDHHDGCLNVRV